MRKCASSIWQMAMAFFKMSSSCASRLGYAQDPHFGGFSWVGGQGLLRRFLLIVEQLGVDIEGSGSGQRRATFAR